MNNEDGTGHHVVTKSQLLELLKDVPMDADIGFRHGMRSFHVLEVRELDGDFHASPRKRFNFILVPCDPAD